LEVEMKEKAKTYLVKMLGNYDKYESGQEIAVSEAEAVKLLSLGYAKQVEAPAEAKE
jgi:hypothetical protein